MRRMLAAALCAIALSSTYAGKKRTQVLYDARTYPREILQTCEEEADTLRLKVERRKASGPVELEAVASCSCKGVAEALNLIEEYQQNGKGKYALRVHINGFREGEEYTYEMIKVTDGETTVPLCQ